MLICFTEVADADDRAVERENWAIRITSRV